MSASIKKKSERFQITNDTPQGLRKITFQTQN
jgi:hypothetical protein